MLILKVSILYFTYYSTLFMHLYVLLIVYMYSTFHLHDAYVYNMYILHCVFCIIHTHYVLIIIIIII